MRKIIFETDKIVVKEFLKKRFEDSLIKPKIYVSGEIKVLIDINNLLFSLAKETTAFYSIFVENDQIIERYELKGFSFEIFTNDTLENTFTEEILKYLRVINVFEFENELEVKLFVKLLNECGLKIIKNKLKLETNSYPANISMNHNFCVIKDALVPFTEAEKEYIIKKTNYVFESFRKKEITRTKASL